MKKADYIFHKDKKQQIKKLSEENKPTAWEGFNNYPSNKPIFMPKRKKFKS